ncbi:MAG: glycosyltransferase [Verrucomicrobiales bacterium]|nr:glycosyltransferase [Verrucomicrobiales bacterium]
MQSPAFARLAALTVAWIYMDTAWQFLLVIPAYRETRRLPPYLRALTAALADAEFTTALLVVDDGSPSAEQAELRGFAAPRRAGNCQILPPLLLPRNTGKGGAILAGWRHGVAAARWLAFVDADGAVPAGEVRRVFALAHRQRAANCWFGARDRTAGRHVQRRWLRGLLGKIFAWLARTWLGAEVHDSQCGFKLIPAALFQTNGVAIQETGFCFDLDLWLTARRAGAVIVSLPVDWRDQPGGQLRVWRDGWAMLRQLRRLRKRVASGG